jgi:hypothetical protein
VTALRNESEEDLQRLAEQRPRTLLWEFFDFLRYNKRWWLAPIVLLLLLLGLIVVLVTSAPPFIYPL